jgi:hypothetical protein
MIRTLVIGIPLPDASFDNYSFTSAPSISDYPQLIVEVAAASETIEEIVAGTREHRTFAGQAVANQPSTSRTFALTELVAMRRREAVRFFERGGRAACFAYPDVALPGVSGAPDFHRYGWLPEPERFSYGTSLLACFGKEQVTADDSTHPFASFINEFGARSAYQVCADEDVLISAGGRVVGRTPGGDVVAFELPAGSGSLVFLPPVRNARELRQQIAETLLKCFEAASPATPSAIPDWIRKEVS